MLKESTIKKYTNKQLLNHIAIVMSKRENPFFRVDQYRGLYRLQHNHYVFYCSSHNRDELIQVIKKHT